ncbi:MAG: HAD-IA family hydrolase [Candidatus Saccharimonadales bacterium]
MIKAIIFDCFGVLVQGSLGAFIHKHFHDNPEARQRVDELNRMANLGYIDYKQFVDGVAELARMSWEQTNKELDQTPANVELFTYIREQLKPTYKIGMLSNAADDWLDELFTPEQVAVFDDVVLSYRSGMAKPDKAIYRLSSENLDVQENECVFIDDVEMFCEAARSVGMKAICFHDVEQLRRDLDNILTSAK